MDIKVDPADEWKAAVRGAGKALLKFIPGVGVPLSAYEELNKQRRQKALEDLLSDILSKLDRVGDRCKPEWFGTEDGRIFANKVVDAALDAQMADKRQLFSNVLINGLLSEDLSASAKMKFVDLLRGLSRVALDVLAELHQICEPSLKGNGATHISSPDISRHIATNTGMDPYLVGAAVAELQSAGLFSNVTSWQKNIQGHPIPSGRWLNDGQGYTEFTERFCKFITEPV